MSIRIAAVATQFIGAIWALLALLYPGHDFAAGIAVTLAGLLVWAVAGWLEDR